MTIRPEPCFVWIPRFFVPRVKIHCIINGRLFVSGDRHIYTYRITNGFKEKKGKETPNSSISSRERNGKGKSATGYPVYAQKQCWVDKVEDSYSNEPSECESHLAE